MAVAPKKPNAAHHHRMIEHHARELRKMAHGGFTKKTEAKGGREAAREEKRKPRGEFAGKRKS